MRWIMAGNRTIMRELRSWGEREERVSVTIVKTREHNNAGLFIDNCFRDSCNRWWTITLDTYTYVFYKFLDVYLIPDPSQEVSIQMTYCIWPHYSNKLKTKTRQTNIVNFSLLNCGELWGRGEEGSHLPIHRIVCLDTAAPDLLRLFCCCCCSIPRMMRMSEWLFLGFRVWARASRTDRIWFAVLCIRSLCSSYSIFLGERARCLPCRETDALNCYNCSSPVTL